MVPSSRLSSQTNPGIDVTPNITNQTIRITNEIDPLIEKINNEVKISESIMEKKETLISDPKSLIKLKKYKQTLNKLIQSLETRIKAISDNSLEINTEINLHLNQSLQNIKVLNNLCKNIYETCSDKPE
tara:strand:- start:1057 stop:1443 length:387 start_codon:yes stop_codon:yes gene_type:complete